VNKSQLDTKLNLAGGSMTGNINMNTGVLRFGAGNITSTNIDGDAVFTRLRGGNGHTVVINENQCEINTDLNMLTNKIVNVGSPSIGSDCANKAYVDSVVPTSGAIYTPITLPSPNNGLFRNYNYQTTYQSFLSITTPNFPIPGPNQRIKYTIHLPTLLFNGDSAEVSIRYIYYDSGVRIDPVEEPNDCGNTFKLGERGYEFVLTNNTGILHLTRNAFPTNLRIDIELFVMGGSGSIAKLLTGNSGRQMLPYLETQLITI